MSGDLISRSTLLDELQEELEWEKANGIAMTASSALKIAIRRTKEAPSVDAEPVRWAQVPSFEGIYEISTLAQVRNAKGEILKQQIRREKYTCYKVVSLWKDGRYFKKGIHRLMAEAFIPNPDNLPVVNHKDEDGTNNLLSNLEWCNKSYNASYGTAPAKISKAFKGKASEKRMRVQQIKDGEIVKEYACAGDAERETGIAMCNIRMVCRGKRKTAGGYEWNYCPNCGAKMNAEAEG